MTEIDLYRPQELAASTAMERAADFTTWAPKLQGAAAIAREISTTDFVPAALRGKPAAVAAAIMAGAEMNLGPMASLMHIHIIDGRPSLSSEMQRALVLALGHHIRYREMTTTRCVVDGQRRGEADWTSVTWTLDDAKRAGLDSRQNWKRYPRRMLAARATGELCRMLFADALAGMPYSAEELEDEADDTAAATGSAPAPEPKPRTAQRKQRTRNASPAETAEPPAPPQRSAGEALPPLPGEEEPAPPVPDGTASATGKEPAGGAAPDERDYDTAGTATPPQVKAIWTILRKTYGFGDDQEEQARAVAAHIAHRVSLTSLNHLSHNQAASVIDTLSHWQKQAKDKGEHPRDYLIGVMAAEEAARDE